MAILDTMRGGASLLGQTRTGQSQGDTKGRGIKAGIDTLHHQEGKKINKREDIKAGGLEHLQRVQCLQTTSVRQV